MKEDLSLPVVSPSANQTDATTAEDHAQTIPHVTSMAVWDIPFQIVLNSHFRIKIGVQCSAECNLAGSTVKVYDHSQTLAGVGTLGETILPTTAALYWTELELRAPDSAGPFRWTAVFSETTPDSLHPESTQAFTFATVKPPECMVTVRVVDKESGTPVPHAHVIMQPYSGFTDEAGNVEIGVTRGEYKLWLPRIAHYDTFRKMVQVESDLVLQAELVPAPVPEP